MPKTKQNEIHVTKDGARLIKRDTRGMGEVDEQVTAREVPGTDVCVCQCFRGWSKSTSPHNSGHPTHFMAAF